MTSEEEDQLIKWARDLDTQLMKPIFIFRMAHATLAQHNSSSSRARALKAAKELERIVNSKAWQ